MMLLLAVYASLAGVALLVCVVCLLWRIAQAADRVAAELRGTCGDDAIVTAAARESARRVVEQIAREGGLP